MVLQERDKKILQFIEQMKACDSTHISRIFFKDISTGPTKSRARLTKLTDNGAIKRSRTYINERYIYYIKKPQQIRHKLILTEAYTRLSELCEIVEFIPEFKIGDIRADAFVILKVNGATKTYFFEVEISHNPFNWKKYKDLYESGLVQKQLGVFPTIVGITDKRITPEGDFKSIIIRTDLNNISEVLK